MLVFYVGWQRRLAAVGGAPLMNLALFGYRPFAMGSVVAAYLRHCAVWLDLLLPVYMQRAEPVAVLCRHDLLPSRPGALAVTIAMVEPSGRSGSSSCWWCGWACWRCLCADEHHITLTSTYGFGGVGHTGPHRAGVYCLP
jgi:hypothetical protein